MAVKKLFKKLKILYILVLYYTYLYCFPCNQLLFILFRIALIEEIVNIIITNNKGKIVVDDVLKTNSKGKAKLDLNLKKGTYQVNVTYNGNENYTGNTSTQKLTIKEETKKNY